jgi:hypothetical protein
VFRNCAVGHFPCLGSDKLISPHREEIWFEMHGVSWVLQAPVVQTTPRFPHHFIELIVILYRARVFWYVRRIAQAMRRSAKSLLWLGVTVSCTGPEAFSGAAI